MISRLYFISDLAYDQLNTLAIRQGYVKPESQVRRGFSRFLDDLSEMEFVDNRPNDIKERHEFEIRNHRAPTWKTYMYRRTRSLTLRDSTIFNLTKLAYKMGIVLEEPWAIGGPSQLRNAPLLGYVIESIGLDWIHPTKYPFSEKI